MCAWLVSTKALRDYSAALTAPNTTLDERYLLPKAGRCTTPYLACSLSGYGSFLLPSPEGDPRRWPDHWWLSIDSRVTRRRSSQTHWALVVVRRRQYNADRLNDLTECRQSQQVNYQKISHILSCLFFNACQAKAIKARYNPRYKKTLKATSPILQIHSTP